MVLLRFDFKGRCVSNSVSELLSPPDPSSFLDTLVVLLRFDFEERSVFLTLLDCRRGAGGEEAGFPRRGLEVADTDFRVALGAMFDNPYVVKKINLYYSATIVIRWQMNKV